jgi:prepilin-type N-terminal cleavage/methylation domain-containing protein
MKARGFTLLELSVVLTITALVLPFVWVVGRSLEADYRDALAQAVAAREMRALSEELRRDLRTLRLQGGSGLRLSGPGACGVVEYALAGEVLERRGPAACGGTRAVATPVHSLGREGDRLEVIFASHSGREREGGTRFLAVLPVEGAP